MFQIAKACFMGLAFCMFLPAVGFVLTGWAILLKLHAAYTSLTVGQPVVGAAYLTGQETTTPAAGNTELDELQARVNELRRK
jgi:hypothetical protein